MKFSNKNEEPVSIMLLELEDILEEKRTGFEEKVMKELKRLVKEIESLQEYKWMYEGLNK